MKSARVGLALALRLLLLAAAAACVQSIPVSDAAAVLARLVRGGCTVFEKPLPAELRLPGSSAVCRTKIAVA